MKKPVIVIEKGVEFARAVRERTKYPFRHMEVGDSFVVPCDYSISVRGAAFSAGKSLGSKFATRTVDGGANIRVWRTA